MFLNSFNYFRAVSIIFIVIGHCDVFFDDIKPDVFIALFYNLSFGGTSLFVFISGFLFHHIFLKRYNYKQFAFKKVQKVLLPYSLMSIAPIINYVFVKERPIGGDTFFISDATGVYETYILPSLKYYMSGEHMMAYWYIPFIMVVFFMSPLHVYFSRLKISMQLILIFILFIISTLIHRPVESAGFYLLQSVVYFTPIYLLGITCSQHKEFIYMKFQGKEYVFLVISILLALIQYHNGLIGNYHKLPFNFNGIDLMIIQKASLCLFFMVWLHRFEDKEFKILEVLASTSFGIFFIHGFVIFFMRKLQIKFGLIISFNFWLSYVMLVVIVILISLSITLFLRKLFPKRSVNIIGC